MYDSVIPQVKRPVSETRGMAFALFTIITTLAIFRARYNFADPLHEISSLDPGATNSTSPAIITNCVDSCNVSTTKCIDSCDVHYNATDPLHLISTLQLSATNSTTSAIITKCVNSCNVNTTKCIATCNAPPHSLLNDFEAMVSVYQFCTFAVVGGFGMQINWGTFSSYFSVLRSPEFGGNDVKKDSYLISKIVAKHTNWVLFCYFAILLTCIPSLLFAGVSTQVEALVGVICVVVSFLFFVLVWVRGNRNVMDVCEDAGYFNKSKLSCKMRVLDLITLTFPAMISWFCGWLFMHLLSVCKLCGRIFTPFLSLFCCVVQFIFCGRLFTLVLSVLCCVCCVCYGDCKKQHPVELEHFTSVV